MAWRRSAQLFRLSLFALATAAAGVSLRDTGAELCRGYELPLPQTRAPHLQHIHVAYSSNLGVHSWGLLTSMVTLATHLKDPGQCDIHLLIAKNTMDEARSLVERYRRELSTFPAIPQVILHEIMPLKFNISTFNRTSETNEMIRSRLHRPETFVRLRLTDYLPGVHRVLWLDHDTLIQSDVGPLFHMEMKHAIAAAPEWCGLLCPLAAFARPSGLEELRRREEYFEPTYPGFDTGIVLMDLDRWRRERLPERVEDWVKVTNGYEGDLSAFNIYFRGLLLIDVLDWRWNSQPHYYHGLLNISWPEECLRQARIVHFSGGYKPWADCENVTEKTQDPACSSAFKWRLKEIFERRAVPKP